MMAMGAMAWKQVITMITTIIDQHSSAMLGGLLDQPEVSAADEWSPSTLGQPPAAILFHLLDAHWGGCCRDWPRGTARWAQASTNCIPRRSHGMME
jgi:hypothetical protein